ncbi:hypothetical protein WR25_15728 [Diploscapter pachys]|uniref:Glycoside hydrolase family 38 central domain-containing protein n=1 Tax=Diploscapter pachys TaxID=2018661 RepID=A0A2A2J3B9_9BILA|nr:hypothetical protein WR25_15728 [Diploscapter pachys]
MPFQYLQISRILSDRDYSNDKNEDIYVTLHKRETHIEVHGHSINFLTKIEKSEPKKLRIHIVFHSHVDPGWLNTFEEYYNVSVHNILTSTIYALEKYPRLRFIWSEISFLERFWQDATAEEKKKFLELVKSERLEICGGAWVMTDEATPLFYAAIENMIEGHQFVHKEIGIRPKSSWSVDPFGHGYMLPHLLPYTGVESMVIGRFHDHVKQRLREAQKLRWIWQPPYYEMETNGPIVNSLPYFVYTTQHACPDTKLCGCYHIGPSSRAQCIGGTSMKNMNKTNADKITEAFVNQMKQVQKVYGTDDILVAIGDDFFFANRTDFDEMYHGFAMMADNLKERYFDQIEMDFTTISEFFNRIKNQSLATLVGDFFPYTANKDENHPWWTGYYAHRPYYKTLERRLQASFKNGLRSLDILRVAIKSNESFSELQQAKRDFSLFQHHDGITGTSRPHVMADYERRMNDAMALSMRVFAAMTADIMKLEAPPQLVNKIVN